MPLEPNNNHNKIRVGIVAPVHNRKELTLQCLRSIGRLTVSMIDVHVVITDDGSTDGTSEAIKTEFPFVEVIEGDGNLWFTEGTNVAIRAALKRDPKYLLLINDDQVFDENALASMIECAENNPRSVVGPLLLLWDTPHKLFQTSPVWETWSGGWRHWRHQTVWTIPRKPWEVELIVGNCLLVPKAAIDEAGLMNSKWFPNFGDAEYTPRLRKLGWRLMIDPRARVFCQPNSLPSRIRDLTVGKAFRVLFLDRGHPHNLLRRFLANWSGAPSRLSGVIAFGVFLIRAAIGRNLEGNWAETKPEMPLKDRYDSSE